MQPDDLIGRLYESAAMPEIWPDTLEEITRHIDAAGCTLITVDRAPPVWVSSPGIVKNVHRYFDEGWAAKNDRMQKLLGDGYAGFIRDIDIYPQDEVGEIPIVKQFFREIGYGWSAALATPMPSGEVLLFSVEQFWADGPITDESLARLDALRPHISRASLLAAKLCFQRATGAVEALELVGTPAALVRADTTVLAANDLFVGLGRQLSIGARDRLRVSFEGAGALIEQALNGARGPGGRRPPLSIAAPAEDDAPPLVLHILPTEGRARDLFGAETALMLVTRLDRASAPEAGLLRALFDLTPMEARVAQALVVGEVNDEAARRLGIGSETLKTHVKNVLRKTGFRRRVELARFLAGIPAYGA